MSMPDRASPDPESLFVLFPPDEYLRAYQEIPADQLPSPYHGLLVHEYHMTVTVEDYYGQQVDVKVLQVRQSGEYYARKILLALQNTGRIVQFGIMRIHFRYCSEQVREEILAEQTPLGRVLIENNVLRRIEPTAYLRVTPGPAMMEWFGLSEPRITYGRFALIHCNGQPAVELLEIVAPP
jgi:chorismate-pyruvate lyase